MSTKHGPGLRARRARVQVVLFLCTFSGCASLRLDGGGGAGLRITCNVPEASLLVDDVYLGPAREWQAEGRFIKPGHHRIEVRHPNYYTHYTEVFMAAGEDLHLHIVLHPLLD